MLVDKASNPVFAASGHLLFVRESSLFAVAFDAERLELRGEPAPIIEGILTFAAGAANFAVSEEGSLVYVRGELGVTLAWVDRQGRSVPIRTGRWLGTPQLSPDGRRAAVEMGNDEGGLDIWIYDAARNAFTRFTTAEGSNRNPRWSPDGRWLAFTSNRDGGYDLCRKPADFSGEVERLLEKKGYQSPEAFSPGGEFLIYIEADATGKPDLWMLPLKSGSAPSPIFQTPFSESQAALSPDGRWLAYLGRVGPRGSLRARAYRTRRPIAGLD